MQYRHELCQVTNSAHLRSTGSVLLHLYTKLVELWNIEPVKTLGDTVVVPSFNSEEKWTCDHLERCNILGHCPSISCYGP